MPSPLNSNDVSIVNLPSDIVRKIIGVGLESVGGMRLVSRLHVFFHFFVIQFIERNLALNGTDFFQISHRWNALALEHLTHRDRLPVIKNFCFRSEDGGILKPIVHVARKYRGYFGLQHQSEVANELVSGVFYNFEACTM